MTRSQMKCSSPQDVIAYLLECNLATIDDLALQKRPRMNELRRQIAIAQFALDFLVETQSAIPTDGRLFDVALSGSVTLYAHALRQKHKLPALNL